ncbi:MAG: hypothetical protein KGL39_00900 [Patescibacteria group bacterium]|nr:hypothetical protein [Patescibacteria group bacterium]
MNHFNERLDYGTFLRSKRHENEQYGFEPLWMPNLLYGFQSYLDNWAIRKGRGALLVDCGLGKGHPNGTKILSPTGWVTIENLQAGDQVIGSDGGPCSVIGVYKRGVLPCYRVYFDDATSIVVDSEHLWAVKDHNDLARENDWKVLATSQLIEGPLKYGENDQSRKWTIPMVQPVKFVETEKFLVPPYVLGVLLGDGVLGNGGVRWSKPDEFIASKIAKTLSSEYHVRKKQGNNWSIVTEPNEAPNPIRNWIAEKGLDVPSYEKYVPREYLFASYNSRVELLRGLMDTDGYAGQSPEFSSSSKELAEAVVFLAQSLGGTASLSKKEFPEYVYNNEKRIGRPGYRVVLSVPVPNPFSLPRKRDLWKSPSRGLGRRIDRIESVGPQEVTCIAVDSPDHLYVADHFIVTHNTVLEQVFAENVIRKENKPALILCPLAVAPQFVREGKKFGIECKQTLNGEVYPCINVTNYERLFHYRPDDFSCLICDEAGILKGLDSKYRKQVTLFASKMKYRLLASATMAPNDYDELGNSSEALGGMNRAQMLGMFFTNGGETTQQWELKGHAKKRFWRWVCTWARACRKPSDLGFPDNDFILPKLLIQQHLVQNKNRKVIGFGMDEAITLDEQRQERRETIQERCEKVAELVAARKDDYAVLWCHLNPEGDLLEKLIPGSVQVAGKDRDEVKEERLTAFGAGQIKVLITKPKIGGWGLNWQHCNYMTWFPSHCYDEVTEVLTKRGWLSFDDVTLSDFVATVNQDNLDVDWQQPTDVIWNYYTGTMFHFCSDKDGSSNVLDLLVTPNHRMFVKQKNGERLFKTAECLYQDFEEQEYQLLSLYPNETTLFSINLAEPPKKVSYSGMIGCVTVPNGTVIVRRNGIPVVSGNSFESFYQGLRRCWRFGQKRQVQADIITSPGERRVLVNMRRKERQADELYSSLVREMSAFQLGKPEQEIKQLMRLPSWM